MSELTQQKMISDATKHYKLYCLANIIPNGHMAELTPNKGYQEQAKNIIGNWILNAIFFSIASER